MSQLNKFAANPKAQIADLKKLVTLQTEQHFIDSLNFAIAWLESAMPWTVEKPSIKEGYYICHQRSGRDTYCDVYEVSKNDFDKLYPFKDSFESTYGKIPLDIKELASDCCDSTLYLTQAQIDQIPDDHWILVTDY